jgi:hypothetical protein
MHQLSVKDLIKSLDDATARRVLDSIARAQTASAETALTPELRQALGDFATDIETATIPAGDGDLARAALLLLADDPQQQPILTALIEGPAPAQFGPIKNAVVVAAVLLVLQTHVRFERDKDGRWSLKIEKKPTDNSLLKILVQKLLSFSPTK